MFGPILVEVVGLTFVLWLVMRRDSKTAASIAIVVLLVALLIAFGIIFGMTFMATDSPSWLIVPIRIAAGIGAMTMLIMVKLNWPSRVKVPLTDHRQGDSDRLKAVTTKRSPQLPPPFL